MISQYLKYSHKKLISVISINQFNKTKDLQIKKIKKKKRKERERLLKKKAVQLHASLLTFYKNDENFA